MMSTFSTNFKIQGEEREKEIGANNNRHNPQSDLNSSRPSLIIEAGLAKQGKTEQLHQSFGFMFRMVRPCVGEDYWRGKAWIMQANVGCRPGIQCFRGDGKKTGVQYHAFS
jgi:hypothetical protein